MCDGRLLATHQRRNHLHRLVEENHVGVGAHLEPPLARQASAALLTSVGRKEVTPVDGSRWHSRSAAGTPS